MGWNKVDEDPSSSTGTSDENFPQCEPSPENDNKEKRATFSLNFSDIYSEIYLRVLNKISPARDDANKNGDFKAIVKPHKRKYFYMYFNRHPMRMR